MNITCTGNTSATGGYGSEVQRFTFHYDIDFGTKDTAFNFAPPTETLTLTAAIATVAASAQIELIKQPNPFILHGDPAWLSIDLRVFHVRAGESRFGATMGADSSSAPQYIRDVIQNFTNGHGTAGRETFDGLPGGAEARVDSTMVNMNQQTDPANIQSFTATGGAEVDVFYGCWLDINQPLKPNGSANNVLPAVVPSTNQDGSFSNALPIQQAIMRNPHQCLVAEIAFDPIAILPGKDPANWDKLAQRNLAWSDLPNPGVDGSRRALNTFEVRPSAFGLQHDRNPDELMIDWSSLPTGTTASIYLPAVLASEVVAIAFRMYTRP